MRFLTEKCDSLPFCFSHTISSYTTSGGGKKGVAIRPYPSPRSQSHVRINFTVRTYLESIYIHYAF